MMVLSVVLASGIQRTGHGVQLVCQAQPVGFGSI
jgi:hypothetical protein